MVNKAIEKYIETYGDNEDDKLLNLAKKIDKVHGTKVTQIIHRTDRIRYTSNWCDIWFMPYIIVNNYSIDLFEFSYNSKTNKGSVVLGWEK